MGCISPSSLCTICFCLRCSGCSSLFSRALVTVLEVEECKAKARESPHEPGPPGLCCSSSLGRALPPPEINDTLGSMWGLGAKANTQTISQAGLVTHRSGCKIPLDPSLQHTWSPNASVLCRWTSCFPPFRVSRGTGLCTLVPTTIPSPAHLGITHLLPLRPPWVTWMHRVLWDIPTGFWLAVGLLEGYFLPV